LFRNSQLRRPLALTQAIVPHVSEPGQAGIEAGSSAFAAPPSRPRRRNQRWDKRRRAWASLASRCRPIEGLSIVAVTPVAIPRACEEAQEVASWAWIGGDLENVGYRYLPILFRSWTRAHRARVSRDKNVTKPSALLFAAVVAVSSLHMASADQSSQTATALRGNSITLSWTSAKRIRGISGPGAGREYNAKDSLNLKVYVNLQGRVFSSFDAHGRRNREPTSFQHSESENTTLHWRFENGALVADQAFVRGTRRIIVSSNDGFKTCSLDLICGIQGGVAPLVVHGMGLDTTDYEIIDNEISAKSCSVQQGNAFSR